MLIPRGSYARLPESAAARRAGGLGWWGRGPRSARRLASLLRAERAQGRPEVRSGLSARPVRPSGKEEEIGRSQVAGVWGWLGGVGGARVALRGFRGKRTSGDSPKPLPRLWVRAERGRRGGSCRPGALRGGRTPPDPTMSVGGCECGEGKGDTPGCLSSTYLGLCVPVGVTSGLPRPLPASVCVGDSPGTPSPAWPGSVHVMGRGCLPQPCLPAWPGCVCAGGGEQRRGASPAARGAPSSARPVRAPGDLPDSGAAAGGGGRGLGRGVQTPELRAQTSELRSPKRRS